MNTEGLTVFGVYPKYISFDLRNVSNSDAVYIRNSRLLKIQDLNLQDLAL